MSNREAGDDCGYWGKKSKLCGVRAVITLIVVPSVAVGKHSKGRSQTSDETTSC